MPINSGLFAQLNDAVLRNPLAQKYNFGAPGVAARRADTMNPMLREGMKGITGAMGMAPEEVGLQTGQEALVAQMEAERAKEEARQQALFARQQQAREQLAKTAMELDRPDLAMMVSNETNDTAAIAKQIAEAGKERKAQKDTQAKRNTVAESAEKVGLTGLATSLKEGVGDPNKAAEEVRTHVLNEKLKTQDQNTKVKVLMGQGLSKEEASLAASTDESFEKALKGELGDARQYSLNGENVVLHHYNGKVKVDGVWRDPHSVEGLEGAATKTRDLTAEQQARIDSLKDLDPVGAYEDAEAALKDLQNIADTEGELEGAITGFGQGPILTALKVKDLGEKAISHVFGEGDHVTDPRITATETYEAASGRRVAGIIKDFGSGAGVSEADREYAKAIIGGTITMSPEALEKLLAIQKRAAGYKLRKYAYIAELQRQAYRDQGLPELQNRVVDPAMFLDKANDLDLELFEEWDHDKSISGYTGYEGAGESKATPKGVEGDVPTPKASQVTPDPSSYFGS